MVIITPEQAAERISPIFKGRKGRFFFNIAARLTERGERAVRQTVSRVEPALVIISCILVGLILLTVMLPLMNIMSAIG